MRIQIGYTPDDSIRKGILNETNRLGSIYEVCDETQAVKVIKDYTYFYKGILMVVSSDWECGIKVYYTLLIRL
jgi:hypothetical protein